MPAPPNLNRPQVHTTRILTASISMAALAASVAAVDQLSKGLAVTRLANGPTEGPGPFWFRLVANRGALMGFPLPTWLILGGSLAVAVIAIKEVTSGAARHTILGWGLVIGGAAGNILDRFQHRSRFPDHAVVDWVASTSLPTFNLADAAIIAGLVLVTLAASTTPQRQKAKREVSV